MNRVKTAKILILAAAGLSFPFQFACGFSWTRKRVCSSDCGSRQSFHLDH